MIPSASSRNSIYTFCNGCTVVIATSTNDFGKYSLIVSAKGDYLVRFSIVGYETKFFGPFISLEI